MGLKLTEDMTFELKDEIQVKCPFCRGVCYFGFLPDGNGAALHSIPTCKVYNELEPDKFIERVRKALQS